ncbi:hypothetical protein I316_06829 [Kwoniella heveanensis BCC8398]|uniref:DlpA domain-containing protein n=1 Tax=Kwoniella heveanensis BCC8398 TaxID=1296120 RepID=A0A1B9GKA4_9TREE|nr:hypothetical protein I316_06829 [Kwoniella heveanensis BCC8398]
MLSPQVLKRVVTALKPYASCDVADALTRLKHKGGGFLPGIVMHSPQYQEGDAKIVGPAHTVKFRHNADKGFAPQIEGHYIDKTPSDHVLFLAPPANITNAVYGEIMSARLQRLGAVGTVIAGRLRDANEQRQMNWPVFARGVGTTAGGDACFPSEMGVAVELEHTEGGKVFKNTINPGDIIIADANGVVAIPHGLAEKVVEIVPQLVKADQACLKDVLDGRSVTETFKDHRGRLQC